MNAERRVFVGFEREGVGKRERYRVTTVSERCVAVPRVPRVTREGPGAYLLRAPVLATIIKRERRTECASKSETERIEMTKPLVRPSEGPHERCQG